jgi:catechol 2,3-dioxygenase-like lactoylglutathione lyase family enzyme
MVATVRTFGSFSVDDLDASRTFYGDLLGMKVSLVSEEGPLWLHGPGSCDTLVYLKPDHTPASFTVLNLSVGDIERAVDELVELGISFERYTGLETDERGIFHGAGHSVAWFTDPAGNNLSVVEER